VFRIRDRVTDNTGNIRSVVAAVLREGNTQRILRDWELLVVLNCVPVGRTKLVEPSRRPLDPLKIRGMIEEATLALQTGANTLDLPFQYPEVEVLACLLPDGA
jgi:hypothetical protein